MPPILLRKYVDRYIYHALREMAGWPDGVGLIEQSLLFKPPGTSSKDDIPAHLGWDRNKSPIRSIIEKFALALLGQTLMEGIEIPYMEGEPDNFNTFGELCHKTQIRLNSAIVDTLGNRVLIEVVSKWKPGQILGEHPPPDFVSTVAQDQFVADLLTELRFRLGDLQELFDELLITPETKGKICKAEFLYQIRDVLLEDIVAPILIRRMENNT